MAINFANVKAITIPEGNVKSIASGSTILWKYTYPSSYTVTMTNSNTSVGSNVKITDNTFFDMLDDLVGTGNNAQVTISITVHNTNENQDYTTTQSMTLEWEAGGYTNSWGIYSSSFDLVYNSNSDTYWISYFRISSTQFIFDHLQFPSGVELIGQDITLQVTTV